MLVTKNYVKICITERCAETFDEVKSPSVSPDEVGAETPKKSEKEASVYADNSVVFLSKLWLV